MIDASVARVGLKTYGVVSWRGDRKTRQCRMVGRLCAADGFHDGAAQACPERSRRMVGGAASITMKMA